MAFNNTTTKVGQNTPLPELMRQMQELLLRTFTVGRGLNMRRFGTNRIILEATGASSGAGVGAAIECEITAIGATSLTCDSSLGSITVTRPVLLRSVTATISYPAGDIDYTTVNAQERTADDGVTSVTQVMTPQYYVGELIYALPVGAGYIDLNVAGRQWAQPL